MCVFVAMMAVFASVCGPGVGALTAGQRAERKMTRAINAVRAQHGLPAFRRSAVTDRVGGALLELPDGSTTSSRTRARSGPAAASRLLGEALAWHSGRRFNVA